MLSPITGKPMKLVREKRPFHFRKEQFNIVFHFYFCEDSGSEFTNEYLDNKNLNQVHNQYREKYGIPFSEEIKEIREKYDVSASKMSEILGLGQNSYRLYESGEIPSVSIGRLILSVNQPEEFIRQVKASSHLISPKEVKKIIQKANEVDNSELKFLFSDFFLNEKPNEFTGYRKFNLARVSSTISFLGTKIDLYKTKLNKLLFYCDFLCYKEVGYSITGLKYRAIPFGPVPADYDKLYLLLNEIDEIDVVEILYDNGNFGEKIVSKKDFNISLLNKEETYILNSVITKFGDLTSNQIVNLSHQEEAWTANENERRVISFQKYAYDLKAF